MSDAHARTALQPSGFLIIDKHTGATVGRARTRAGAWRSVDRRDNAYGAYRYTVRPVYESAPVTPAR